MKNINHTCLVVEGLKQSLEFFDKAVQKNLNKTTGLSLTGLAPDIVPNSNNQFKNFKWVESSDNSLVYSFSNPSPPPMKDFLCLSESYPDLLFHVNTDSWWFDYIEYESMQNGTRLDSQRGGYKEYTEMKIHIENCIATDKIMFEGSLECMNLPARKTYHKFDFMNVVREHISFTAHYPFSDKAPHENEVIVTLGEVPKDFEAEFFKSAILVHITEGYEDLMPQVQAAILEALMPEKKETDKKKFKV